MTYPPPSAYHLHERLFQLGAVETHPADTTPLTADDALYAINAMLASEAVCCRCLVDGKPKLLRFREMWCAVYGGKWAWAKKGDAA
jgi:hypothetical protein